MKTTNGRVRERFRCQELQTLRNIEIKTLLEDRYAVEERLRQLGARFVWSRQQRDTFFQVVQGWLKIREVQGYPTELISYRRAEGVDGMQASSYDVEIVPDAERWKRLFSRVLPVDGVVDKERTLWLYEHTRIHLDRVSGLGEFLELETVVSGISVEFAEAECQRIVESLALDPARFVDVPYRDLFA
ncbi:MAG: class IV adenylate cyclase [Planctomycetes bacterium]|nr:class IV adenylate cyclase [Planctomycetota bacterium]